MRASCSPSQRNCGSPCAVRSSGHGQLLFEMVATRFHRAQQGHLRGHGGAHGGGTVVLTTTLIGLTSHPDTCFEAHKVALCACAHGGNAARAKSVRRFCWRSRRIWRVFGRLRHVRCEFTSSYVADVNFECPMSAANGHLRWAASCIQPWWYPSAGGGAYFCPMRYSNSMRLLSP